MSLTVVEPSRLALNPMSIAVLAGCLVGAADRIINLIDFRQCIDPHCRFTTWVGIGLRQLPREIDLQIAALQYTPAIASVIFASIVVFTPGKIKHFSKAIASTLSLAAVGRRHLFDRPVSNRRGHRSFLTRRSNLFSDQNSATCAMESTRILVEFLSRLFGSKLLHLF